MSEDIIGNVAAEPAEVFVCTACGKVSVDRYGYQSISRGWDESCMLNAICVRRDQIVWNAEHTRALRVEGEPTGEGP